MAKKPINSTKSIISSIYSSLSSFFNEAFKFLKAIFSSVYSSLKTYSKQIFAALVILFSCLVLSYSLIISTTLALSYMLYSINAQITKSRAEIAADPKQQGKLGTVKDLVVGNKLETMAYRSYGYFSHQKKSALKEELSEGDIASFASIKDEFAVHGSLTESGINALFAKPKKDGVTDENTVVVGFRGTDSRDPDETVLADFEKNGPGFDSYHRVKDGLFAEFEKLVAGKTTVNTAGHSFGGGINQMFIADLLDKIAEKKDGYSHITEVNMAVFQSTGVDSSYNVKAKAALEKLASENSSFRLNMIAHCYDGDIVHASAPYILADHAPVNANLYYVRKHMTLWIFLTTLLGNIFSAHSLPFYENQGIVDSAVIRNANLNAPMRVYSSAEAADLEKIQEVYKADYMRFLSNGTVHNWLSYIGISHLKFIRDIILFTLAFSLFAIKLAAFITLPSLITYGIMLVSLLPLLKTVFAPSFEPIRDKIGKWYSQASLKLSKVTARFCSSSSIKPIASDRAEVSGSSTPCSAFGNSVVANL